MISTVEEQYFPFTNKCGRFSGSEDCILNGCKFWLGELRCWIREFDYIIVDIFGEENCSGMVHFKDKNGDWPDHFSFLILSLRYNSRTKYDDPVTVEIELRFTSERVAERVKEKFGLQDWKIDGRNEDGGDDHGLLTSIDGSYSNKDKIVEIFKELRDRMVPEIIEYTKEVSACSLCKNQSSALNDHGEYSLCFRCQMKIVDENIHRYFS